MQKDLMVASDLQRALITEIESLLSELSAGQEEIPEHLEEPSAVPHGFKGYAQFLPVLRNDDEDEDQFFPYFIVRMDGAKTVEDDDLWEVSVSILLGVRDYDQQNIGHFRVANAIDRIITRFCYEATLGVPGHKAFRCMPEMEWALQDEDTYPYYFGAVSLKFMAPKPSRKDPILNGYH